jgi:hypothetical protein
MPKQKLPSIDPLFNKPHDYISGIVQMDPGRVHRLSSYNASGIRKTEKARVSKRGVKAAMAATALGAGLMLVNNIDEADKKSEISYEADILANSEKTVLKGQIILNTGVNVRRYPSIVKPDEYNEGNVAFVVDDGQKLIIENPVSVSVNPDETWFAFTMNKGGPEGNDPITLWVKNNVLNQTSNDGVPYAQLGIDGLYESGLGEKVSVDSYGFMSVDGNPVSIGQSIID